MLSLTFSSDAHFVLRRVLRYCAVVAVAAYPIARVPSMMSAMVVKADFLGSWVQVVNTHNQKDRATFRVHAANQGTLESGDAIATVIFPDGWEFMDSHCPIGVVTTRERGYGNELVWNLPSLMIDQAVECDLDFISPHKAGSSARFLFSITSKNARAVYQEAEWQGNGSFKTQLFFELKTWLKGIGIWTQNTWDELIHSVLRSG